MDEDFWTTRIGTVFSGTLCNCSKKLDVVVATMLLIASLLSLNCKYAHYLQKTCLPPCVYIKRMATYPPIEVHSLGHPG